MAITSSHCECELIRLLLTQNNTRFTMRWSFDTDWLVVLRAMSYYEVELWYWPTCGAPCYVFLWGGALILTHLWCSVQASLWGGALILTHLWCSALSLTMRWSIDTDPLVVLHASLTMRWSFDTDPLVVLRAKPYIVKNNCLTQKLYHSSENVIQKWHVHSSLISTKSMYPNIMQRFLASSAMFKGEIPHIVRTLREFTMVFFSDDSHFCFCLCFALLFLVRDHGVCSLSNRLMLSSELKLAAIATEPQLTAHNLCTLTATVSRIGLLYTRLNMFCS